MTVGSLFAGIGGFDLGLERAGFTIRWQVENDPYCNRVLEKHWPTVKRYGDIRQIDWRKIEPVALLCGGFPCQPFSLAGQRQGTADDRYLWPEMRLAVLHAEPTWVIAENVPGLVGPALDEVLSDLEAAGYETGTLAVPACAIGAPHIRQRVWIIAYSDRREQRAGTERIRWQAGTDIGRVGKGTTVADAGTDRFSERGAAHDNHRQQPSRNEPDGCRAPLADAEGQPERAGLCPDESTEQRGRRSGDGGSADHPDAGCSLLEGRGASPSTWWATEPAMGELVNGVSGGLVRFGGRVVKSAAHRKEKLRGLGNAIVPQIAEWLGRQIMEVTNGNGETTKEKHRRP